ncbi:hypothetical protein OG21DRAFT_1499862 [Imleria badia]|nr:hypothetical protein OG21DRAFT_1499862 [Imleria badia]
MFSQCFAMGRNAHCTSTLKFLMICLAFVSLLPVAVAIADGTYAIHVHADPTGELVIGADINANSDVKPVITDGDMVVWTIKQDGGLYEIALNDKWYAFNNGGKVEVKKSVDPVTRWAIEVVGDGLFAIKSVNADETWTATGVKSELPVVLKPNNGNKFQKWAFYSV